VAAVVRPDGYVWSATDDPSSVNSLTVPS
jgi:hypothetical protein